jgi:phytoene dehydrogenase-like protein
VVLNLSAMLAGLPIDSVEKHFSVYGAFVTIRLTLLTGEGTVVSMEPDIPHGLIYPLAAKVREYGGEVWTSSPVSRILIEDGAAVGLQTKRGQEVRASHIALAVGNSRLPAFFDELPPELEAPLAKELPLQHEDLFVIRVFDKPVFDATTYTMIADVERNLFNWIVPDSVLAPWNHPDDKAVAVMWGSRGRAADLDTDEAFEAYLDDVGEEAFPGWKDAISARGSISHKHHWLNPLFIGPKVPRRSSVRNLWYGGDGTLPVSGLGSEQAAFAGYDSATQICGALGLPQKWAPA